MLKVLPHVVDATFMDGIVLFEELDRKNRGKAIKGS
jgi:hypothetical protein